MSTARHSLARMRRYRGATAVEYALMLVAIMLLVVVAYKQLGHAVGSQVVRSAAELK